MVENIDGIDGKVKKVFLVIPSNAVEGLKTGQKIFLEGAPVFNLGWVASNVAYNSHGETGKVIGIPLKQIEGGINRNGFKRTYTGSISSVPKNEIYDALPVPDSHIPDSYIR